MNGTQQRDHTTRVRTIERELRDTQDIAAASLEALADRCEAFHRDSQQRDDTLRAGISVERTHRLKMADEQRAYVDNCDRLLWASVNHFRQMPFGQRLRWMVTGRLS